ncbi:hypothetical protein FDECE_1010 [Fusarium decemcellulare]|nr:hypothetical protein FDECE_1010 [Fusarium decemcellulare]
MSDDVAASPQKPKKKLPFKPTALRKSAAAASPKPTQTDEAAPQENDSDDLALFRRSKEMAHTLAADRERRLKRHQKHREVEHKGKEIAGEKHPREDEEEVNHEQHPPSEDVGPAIVESQSPVRRESSEVLEQPHTQTRVDSTSELVTPPPSKRSRLSSSVSSKKRISSADIDDEAFPDASPTPRQRMPDTPSRAPRVEQQGVTPKTSQIISIDSDSDSDDVVALPPASIPTRRLSSGNSSLVQLANQTSLNSSPKPSSPPQDPPEEDEFAEYERRAAEQRAQALLDAASLDGPQQNASVDIWISSKVTCTKTLVVKYRFDHPLSLIRETWINFQKKHGVSIDDAVLTWRGKKVYNASTLLSLGIRPQAGGRVIADNQGSEGFKDNRTKVQMEAWTPELFREMELSAELQRKRAAGELAEEEQQEESILEPVLLKVFLKAKDMEDVGLMVRPETTVDTLVMGFIKKRNVDPGKEVSLWWDGERLEEHVTLEEAEIEDKDVIEVHVR